MLRGTRPPPREKSPWLFSFRPYKVEAMCVSPKKKDRIAYIGKVPKEFQGHRLIASCLEDGNNNNILIESRHQSFGIHVVNPFLSPWTAIRTFPGRDSSSDAIIKLVTRGDTKVAISAISGFAERQLVYTTSKLSGWIKPRVTSDEGLLDRFLQDGLLDLVPGKEDDLLYALNLNADKVLSLNFKPSPQIDGSDSDFHTLDMTLNLPPAGDLNPIESEEGWRCCQEARLVTSPSGLFIVRWRLLSMEGKPKKRQIDVYKLLTNSASEMMWVPVESLDNYSFFLGLDQAIAASTKDFPELRTNCIYVPHDAVYVIDAGDPEKFDLHGDLMECNLVYDLSDKTWVKWHEDNKELLLWSAMWMMPPPLGGNLH